MSKRKNEFPQFIENSGMFDSSEFDNNFYKYNQKNKQSKETKNTQSMFESNFFVKESENQQTLLDKNTNLNIKNLNSPSFFFQDYDDDNSENNDNERLIINTINDLADLDDSNHFSNLNFDNQENPYDQIFSNSNTANNEGNLSDGNYIQYKNLSKATLSNSNLKTNPNTPRNKISNSFSHDLETLENNFSNANSKFNILNNQANYDCNSFKYDINNEFIHYENSNAFNSSCNKINKIDFSLENNRSSNRNSVGLGADYSNSKFSKSLKKDEKFFSTNNKNINFCNNVCYSQEANTDNSAFIANKIFENDSFQLHNDKPSKQSFNSSFKNKQNFNNNNNNFFYQQQANENLNNFQINFNKENFTNKKIESINNKNFFIANKSFKNEIIANCHQTNFNNNSFHYNNDNRYINLNDYSRNSLANNFNNLNNFDSANASVSEYKIYQKNKISKSAFNNACNINNHNQNNSQQNIFVNKLNSNENSNNYLFDRSQSNISIPISNQISNSFNIGIPCRFNLANQFNQNLNNSNFGKVKNNFFMHQQQNINDFPNNTINNNAYFDCNQINNSWGNLIKSTNIYNNNYNNNNYIKNYTNKNNHFLTNNNGDFVYNKDNQNLNNNCVNPTKNIFGNKNKNLKNKLKNKESINNNKINEVNFDNKTNFTENNSIICVSNNSFNNLCNSFHSENSNSNNSQILNSLQQKENKKQILNSQKRILSGKSSSGSLISLNSLNNNSECNYSSYNNIDDDLNSKIKGLNLNGYNSENTDCNAKDSTFSSDTKSSCKSLLSKISQKNVIKNNNKKSLFNKEKIEPKKENKEDFIAFLDNISEEIDDYTCSQKGSRILQKYLDSITPEAVDYLIKTIAYKFPKLMKDTYGNYFCQKLIQTCAQEQRIKILNYISNEIVKISHHISGTHAFQSFLDFINIAEEEIIILSSIQNNILEMCYDNNATHVIQKIIICFEEKKRTFINDIIIENLKNLVLNPNGICVQWGLEYCNNILEIIINNIVSLSMQKYSSNVVEKIIDLLNPNLRNKVISELFDPTKLMRFLKNKFFTYVIQKILKKISKEEKLEIKDCILNKITITSKKEKNKLNNFMEILQ